MKIFGVITEGQKKGIILPISQTPKSEFDELDFRNIPNGVLSFTKQDFFDFWKDRGGCGTVFYVPYNTNAERCAYDLTTIAKGRERNYCSISLAVFLSSLAQSNNEDRESISFTHICATGLVRKNQNGTLIADEIKEVEAKYSNFSNYVDQNTNPYDSFCFIYVSSQIIDFKENKNNKKIKIIHIIPGTTIDSLLIQMKGAGRTKNLNALEDKVCEYLKKSKKSKFRIENYITGTNNFYLFDELRKVCLDLKIPSTYYLQQPFSEQALDPMIQYVKKIVKNESESWISVVDKKDKIQKINNNLLKAQRALQPLNDNENIKICSDSKAVIKENKNNTIFVIRNNVPEIIITQIDDKIVDFEIHEDELLCDKIHTIKEAFIPKGKSVKTEVLTFQNDPFARMTKRDRFENIFNSVFHGEIDYQKFFNSGKKIKSITTPKKYLNQKYGELTFKELLQNGNFLETEFLLYDTIDYLCQTGNPVYARRKDCVSDCSKCNHKKECGYVDYFQKKKEEDFRLQKSDFDLFNTITGSSFTEPLLKKYLIYAMKGNSHDLSQNEALYHEDKNRYDFVCDDTKKIYSFLLQQPTYQKLIIIPDNSAVEFFSDICLALFLLNTNKFENIVFKMNSRPKFVSDVTFQDYEKFKSFLERNDMAYKFFEKYESSGRIQFEYKEDYVQIPYIRDFSEEEIKDLKSADMLIVKGDLNYRRFLLDCFCPFDTPLKSLLPEQLLDQKICFLRMIKSTVVAGLTPIQGEKAHAEIKDRKKTKTDKDHLNSFFSSGNYGMISMSGY